MRRSCSFLLLLGALASVPAIGQSFDLQHDRIRFAELKGQFRFHTGDDPRWADPAFDDSNWALLQSDQSWYDQGYKDYSGFAWYRYRVTVPLGTENLAIFVPVVQDSYALYADGRWIGGLGQFPPHPKVMLGFSQVFAIPAEIVRSDQTIVFSVRVWRSPLFGSFTGAGFNSPPAIGESALVTRWADLQVHDMFWQQASSELLLLVNLAAAVLGLALFLVRPAEREYMWYGLAQVFWTVNSVSSVASYFVSAPFVPIYIANVAGMFAGAFLNLVFFQVLLRQRRAVLFWIGGISILVPIGYSLLMIVGWGSMPGFGQIVGLCFVPYTVALVLLMLHSGLKGNREAWLLIVPCSLSCLSIIYSQLVSTFGLGRYSGIASVNQFLQNVLTWPIHLNHGVIIGTACNIAICSVLILRFAQSRRDEERLSAELEAARMVQHLLIPDEVPSVPGYEIESVYKPAGQVGGDFFQIVPLQRGGALIAIGDVSGKGLPAAMTVSLLVGTFRTLAHYTDSPAEILAAMNQRMLARSQGGFTTCMVLRLDPAGIVTAANAGHISPYVDGREVEVANGLPLGLAADAEYAETIVPLSAGNHLTLLTDGVVEARNPHGELFGFERARKISNEAAESVATAAQRFGQEDDITVLSVSLVGAAVLTA